MQFSLIFLEKLQICDNLAQLFLSEAKDLRGYKGSTDVPIADQNDAHAIIAWSLYACANQRKCKNICFSEKNTYLYATINQ